jgi:hypothetical protein
MVMPATRNEKSVPSACPVQALRHSCAPGHGIDAGSMDVIDATPLQAEVMRMLGIPAG